MAELVRGSAAGVPFVARPPEQGARQAPLIVLWHGFDPPRSEAALAAALPLAGVPDWRVYLGLPMFGERAPAGGPEEIQRLSGEDFLLNVFGPIVESAAQELPAVVAELQSTLPTQPGAIGLVGFSAGGAAALLALASGQVPIATAAAVSPVVELRRFMALMEQQFGMAYPWSDESRACADRLDFIARATDLAAASPALLLTVGDRDPYITDEVTRLHAGLRDRYHDPDRLAVHVVPGQAHEFVPEPGIDPAPQTPEAAQIDATVQEWFARYPLA
jgi:dienelactone hydrolase